MGSLSPPRLPIIDLSMMDLKPNTTSWSLVRTQVVKALEEYGCFEAVYNIVTLELHKAVFDAAEDLFNVPLELKILNTSDKPFYHYVGNRPEYPLYEGLAIDQPSHLEQVQSFTKLMWPKGNPSFCEPMHSFSKHMEELEHMVKRMIFESYGVEKYHDSFSESTEYLLRIMKYKGPMMNESTPGVEAHTDKSCMTVLHQNNVKGLEILLKDGEWITHIPSSESFVVMIGEAFMAWSNGRLHSPCHRVMLIGDEARYSTAFFSFNMGMIETPEEMVDEGHPLLFKPFDNMGLCRFFYTEEGQKAKCTVTAYCGV